MHSNNMDHHHRSTWPSSSLIANWDAEATGMTAATTRSSPTTVVTETPNNNAVGGPTFAFPPSSSPPPSDAIQFYDFDNFLWPILLQKGLKWRRSFGGVYVLGNSTRGLLGDHFVDYFHSKQDVIQYCQHHEYHIVYDEMYGHFIRRHRFQQQQEQQQQQMTMIGSNKIVSNKKRWRRDEGKHDPSTTTAYMEDTLHIPSNNKRARLMHASSPFSSCPFDTGMNNDNLYDISNSHERNTTTNMTTNGMDCI